MNCIFFGNGGSGNHGCEAIVRGTVQALGDNNTYQIHSASVEEDLSYGLGQLARITPAKSDRKRDLAFMRAYAKLKLTGDYVDLDGLYYMPTIHSIPKDLEIALSVGGDNYCYGDAEIYAYLNNAYKKAGCKTVFWGCSVEPEVVAQPAVSKDLANYDLIYARESISYEALKAVNSNTFLAPDPAFFMEPNECDLDERFLSHRIIGINISPMIVSNENVNGIAYVNYKYLIRWIFDNTEDYIALIPHVVWKNNDDRVILRQLYEEFDCSSRLIVVEDHSAPELKYIISKCSLFVGARTHATIAAYSTGVPTLVVGYSVKARGIAQDLFGTTDGYVLPVQTLEHEDDLLQVYLCLLEREEEDREHLIKTVPELMKQMTDVLEAVKKLL